MWALLQNRFSRNINEGSDSIDPFCNDIFVQKSFCVLVYRKSEQTNHFKNVESEFRNKFHRLTST